MLTKIKLEYSNILYNLTHFPGPCVCPIRQYINRVNKKNKEKMWLEQLIVMQLQFKSGYILTYNKAVKLN